MAFPAGLAMATVTAGPVDCGDGTAAVGQRIRLTPEWELIYGGARVLAGGRVMTLDAAGVGSTQVPRSDAAGLVRPNPRYWVEWMRTPGTEYPLPKPYWLYINQPTVDLEVTQPSSGDAGTAVPVAVGPGVAAGGTTGQVLAKTSSADYATGWINPPTGGGGATTDASLLTSGILPPARVGDGSIGVGKLAFDPATQAELDTAIGTRVATTAVGAASGVASLDSGGKIPQAQLPAIALQDFLGTVASQAAMLALVGQRGDWCTRTDTGTDWSLVAEPSSSLGSWRERTYPASPVSSVAGRTGPVTLSADDLTDATATGKAVVRAATPAAARTAIGASGVQLAGHLIRDEGVDLPQRSILDVVGASVTVTDDGTKTTLTVLSTPSSRQAQIGHFVHDSGIAFNNGEFGEGVLHMGCDWLPAGTYDRVVVSVSGGAGSAGAVGRVVAYFHTDGIGPAGAPAVDAVFPATAGSNYLLVDLPTPLVVPAPGAWLWRGIVNQGGATTRGSYMRVVGMGAVQHVAVAGQFTNDTSPVAARVTGVTGTPPTNPTVTYDRLYNRVGFRRSA